MSSNWTIPKGPPGCSKGTMVYSSASVSITVRVWGDNNCHGIHFGSRGTGAWAQGSQLNLPACHSVRAWSGSQGLKQWRAGVAAPSSSHRPGTAESTPLQQPAAQPTRMAGRGLCVPICKLGCLPHFKLRSKEMPGKPRTQQSGFCLQVFNHRLRDTLLSNSAFPSFLLLCQCPKFHIEHSIPLNVLSVACRLSTCHYMLFCLDSKIAYVRLNFTAHKEEKQLQHST